MLLATLCLALYLPGIAALPPVDRDEARFVQATRQMIESGDFIRPRFQSEDRFRKPPGIYWLQSAGVWFARTLLHGGTPPAVSVADPRQGAANGPDGAGASISPGLLAGTSDLTRMWPYRLPSVAGALAAVLLTYHFAILWYPRIVALVGAALLAASVLLVVEAHLGTTDAVLLLLVVAAQGCLGALHLAARRGRPGSIAHAAGFWMAQGLAILVKGPVAPLISALTIAALLLPPARRRSTNVAAALVAAPDAPPRRAQGPRLQPRPGGTNVAQVENRQSLSRGRHKEGVNLRWHWGIPLMLLVVVPWPIAIVRETGGAFFAQWWHGDIWPKLIGGHESHGAPPGTHLALLAVTFWPGSLALVPALAFLRSRCRAAELFHLAWLLPGWLALELMPTKLPHYVLPLLPPLALLCARAVLSVRLARVPRWAHAVTFVWASIGAAIGAGLLAGPLLLAGGIWAGATLAAVGVWVCVVVGARAAFVGRWRAAIPPTLAASVILSLAALGGVLPRLDAIWMSRGAVAAVAVHRRAPGAPLAAAGHHEPSLVFLTGGAVDLVDPTELASFLHQHPDGLGLITADERPRFDAAAAALGISTRLLWSGDGINYSKGRRTRLFLLVADGRDASGTSGSVPVTLSRRSTDSDR